MAEAEPNEVMSKLEDIMVILKQNQRLLQQQEKEITELKQTISDQSEKQGSMERQLALLSTSGLHPKRYSGSVTENARLFVSDFESFSNYIHPNNEHAMMRLFPVLLSGRAKIWFEQHKVGGLSSWRSQREAFLTRFKPSLQTELDALPQRKQQTMGDYIKACEEKIFSLSITDEESKIQSFVEGLLPCYRDSVLESQPSTLEEAEQQALRAERGLRT